MLADGDRAHAGSTPEGGAVSRCGMASLPGEAIATRPDSERPHAGCAPESGAASRCGMASVPGEAIAMLADGDRAHAGWPPEGSAAPRCGMASLPGAATTAPGGSVCGEAPFLAGLVLAPVAEVQGWGAVLTSQLGQLLDGCKVTVRPVVDTRRLPAARGYEIPDVMRLAVTERWPVDAFPYGTLRSTACDLDHSKPYGDGGHTEIDNLAPLKRFGHRVRTHGGWKVEQAEPGRLTWVSPHGYTYAVTAAGTLRIGRPPASEHDWWNQEPPEWLAPD